MEKYRQHLEKLKLSGNLRRLREIKLNNEFITFEEREMINLSSNDYLGLGANQTLWNDFLLKEANFKSEYFPASACSSRLLTGNHSAYKELERTLASCFKTEAALVFNSGYHANVGILPALADSNDLILADKLVHASLIDGIRLSMAKCIRFPHNDLDRLERILQKERSNYERVFVVTESIFSMDGDLADLKQLVEIKNRHNAFLYVDEAHAFGVRGEKGLGRIEELNLFGEIELLVGTFGKAIASQGAFLVCNQIIKDYLINTMRPFIFTTGLPPWSVRWTNYILQHLPSLTKEREHLTQMSNKLREEIRIAGLETAGESHIIPIILRDMNKTIIQSKHLCEEGFFVLPIRPPTVPSGTERLRISLTSNISKQQIEDLCKLCVQIGKQTTAKN